MAFQYIHEHFEKNFFLTKERVALEDTCKKPGMLGLLARKHLGELKASVINPVKEMLSAYLNTDYDVEHFEELWNLGYLPIEVRALEEGGQTCLL